jgi:hypothetical protein
MIQLVINGQVADLTEEALSALAITYAANDIGVLSDRNGDFAKNFDLPLTGNNRLILGLSDQIPSATDTGALLPCEVYYTNWLIFKGSLRVARYFGNKAQVELIGGVGTLVADFANTTLADIRYERLANLTVKPDDYAAGSLGRVIAVKADAGAWGKNPQIGTSIFAAMQMYTEQVPLWYKLTDLIQDVCSNLGVVLGGTLLSDGKLDDVYLMQGRWGKNAAIPTDMGKVLGESENISMTYTLVNIWQFRNYNTNGAVTFLSSATDFVDSGSTIGLPINVRTTTDIGGAMVKVRWVQKVGLVSAYLQDATHRLIQVCYVNDRLLGSVVTEQQRVAGFYTDVEYIAEFEISLALLASMDTTGATGGNVRFGTSYAAKRTTGMALGGYSSWDDITHEISFEVIDRQVSDTIQRPEDKLPATTVADLILEICQRYGYTVNYNTNTSELVFSNLPNLGLRSLSTDWNDKIESPLDSQFGTQYQTEFVFGSYGAINQYKSADGTDIGVLLANVTNNDVAEAYTSIADIPIVATLVNTGGGLLEYCKVSATDTNEVIKELIQDQSYLKDDVVHFRGNWHKAKVDTVATFTDTPGKFIITNNATLGNIITSDWLPISATTAFSANDTIYLGTVRESTSGFLYLQNEGFGYGYVSGLSLIMTPDNLTWQSALDTNYQWLSAILSKPRVHKVLLQLRAIDLPFDFSKPVYWNCAYWYVLSIQDYNPLTQESCVAVIAQIPDYPTA